MKKIYDVIIVGGGPSGLSAGLYAGRARMDSLIIEKGNIGGQITGTNEIENYPGGMPGDSGTSLTERMRLQTEAFGVKIIIDEIISVDVSGPIKVLKSYNALYQAKSVIIASGALPKFLECKGEKEHIGMGVSYCATCDGAFFTGLEIYVVGGGDAALEEAVYLTRFASKVTIIHRRDAFRAAKSVVEKAQKNDKIHFLMDSVITEIKGDGAVDEILLENVISGNIESLKADPQNGMMGVFIYAGYSPNSDIWKNIIKMDAKGYIITDDAMKTNIPGVFAAGDIRQKLLRQVATAVSDGAVSAISASSYVDELI